MSKSSSARRLTDSRRPRSVRRIVSGFSWQTDQVIAIATDFVKRNEVEGLILTGGFIGLFNPGIHAKVSKAIRLPVVTAVSSAVAALKVFAAKSCF